ncbi:MAG: GDP-L-fucose synthase [Desulfobulbaceae bacterium]|nr:GDP-L-fucose synthase [Desulfobulbaceae bacterium]
MNESPLTPDSRIFVAGHRGMVGSAIVRRLTAEGYSKVITQTHAELDLTDQQAVRRFFQNKQIDYVVLAAAKVGGIRANNTYPAEFIYSNLMIETNIIHEAYRAGVMRLLFLGSSCIYPKFAPHPMSEESLLTGVLEPTNEPYAIAKIAGIKLCESYNRQYGTRYRSLMPTNLYGPGDNFDLENSHVIPALIRKFHEAKRNNEPSVEVWGTGAPCREFLHVDDLAGACVFIMGIDDQAYTTHTQPMLSHINAGTGEDVTIRELAETIREVIGFTGNIIFNPDKPDGSPKKLLNVTLINKMGWKASINLKDGLDQTYDWYKIQLHR